MALLAVLMMFTLTPASAHQDHEKQRAQRAQVSIPPSPTTPGAMHEMMKDHADGMEATAPKTFGERAISWAGRTHPFAVHFPIALFPVALVALVLARRRGETVELIRSLIVVAGVASVIAGALGWLSGGYSPSQDDALHFWHRWTGTGLAIAGLLMATRAYRQRKSVFSKTHDCGTGGNHAGLTRAGLAWGRACAWPGSPEFLNASNSGRYAREEIIQSSV